MEHIKEWFEKIIASSIQNTSLDMLIVLFDPRVASCKRFWAVNSDLPCRKWDVTHPVVQRYLARSPRARAVESLPTVIDLDATTGAVSWYTHEQAFVHAQSIREQMNAPPITTSELDYDNPSNLDQSDIVDLIEPAGEMVVPPPAPVEQEVGERMFTSQSELEDAFNKKPREQSATELAAQLRQKREELDSQFVTPGRLPPPPLMGVGYQPEPKARASLVPPPSVSEILGNNHGMHPPDPPGLGMDPE